MWPGGVAGGARPRRTMVFLSVLVCASMCLGQTDTPVPLTQEPSHHLALENDYVRVFKVEVAPHAPTLLHEHDRDYVFVSIGAGEITNAVQGRSPLEQSLADGDTRFAKGPFAHIAINRAATPFRNVTVELKKKTTKEVCGFAGRACPTSMAVTGGSISVGSGGLQSADVKFTQEPIFETDAVRATRVRIQPGGVSPEHEQKQPRLLIAVSDLEITNTGRAGEGTQGMPRPFNVSKQKAGDIVWVPAQGPHTITNNGTQPAHYVILEFK